MFQKKEKEVDTESIIDAVADAIDETVRVDGDNIVTEDKTLTEEASDLIADLVDSDTPDSEKKEKIVKLVDEDDGCDDNACCCCVSCCPKCSEQD